MKNSIKLRRRCNAAIYSGFAILLLATSPLRAGDEDVRQALNDKISTAADFYFSQQSKPETAVPDSVVAAAKGVIIITRWSGAVAVGGTAGSGIGLKKDASGRFSAPAFYTLGGASLGLQVGGSKTQSVAFLMSDKALQTLTDSKFVWSGNVRAVAGPHSSSDSTVDNTADVILYQQSSGLDVGAMVAATEISVDNDGNRAFYGSPMITPSEIFGGSVSIPDSAKPLITALNNQSSVIPTAKGK